MSEFVYVWVDQQNNKIKSVAEAASIESLENILEKQNISVLSIYKSSFFNSLLLSKDDGRNIATPKVKKVKSRELIEFCIHLGVLAEAGVTLTVSLHDYVEETKDENFRGILEVVQQQVLNGTSLSQALSTYSNVFSNEFIYLIRAGEETGTLANSLKELRKYLEWQEKLSADIAQATTYPKVVSAVLGLFILYLFSNIVPGIAKVLLDLKIELPIMTRIVMAISDFCLSYWWAIILVSFGIPLLLKYLSRKFDAVSDYLDQKKLQLPILGELISLLLQARFIHNFAIIHKAGVSILENLNLCQKFLNNRIYQNAVINIRQNISDGESLSEAMKKTNLFTGLIMRMVSVGESSGSLDDSLRFASEYYDEEIPRRLKKVFALLEPALILVLIGVVGFVALAIFIPILSISGGIK